jgi:hypothetical protein
MEKIKFYTIILFFGIYFSTHCVFAHNAKLLECNVKGNPTVSEANMTNYFINCAKLVESNPIWTSCVVVAIIDSATLQPWNSSIKNLGQLNFGSNPAFDNVFIYNTNNTSQMNAMVQAMADSVPDGSFILAYTWRYGNFSKWYGANPLIPIAMNAIGATEIAKATDSIPYIMFTRKGHPNLTQEVLGNNVNDTIQLSTIISDNPQESLVFSSDSAIYFEGDTVSLTGPDGYASYYWNTGSTSQILKTSNPGIYILRVTDSTGCIIRDTVMIKDKRGTFINKNENNVEFSFYPNPVKAKLSVVSNLPIDFIRFYNLNGQLIQEIKLRNTKNFEADLSILDVGVYFIEASISGERIHQKIIKN